MSGLQGRALAEWVLPLARGAVERAAAGLAQPIDVRAHDALTAEQCPAQHRELLIRDVGWPGWSPPLAARRVAIGALRAHLDGAYDDLPLPDPLALVREHLRSARAAPSSSLDEWLAGEASDDERRQTAAAATRWAAALLRMVGWPLPARTTFDVSARWNHGEVSTVATVDALVGRVTAAGEHQAWLLRTSSGAGPAALRDRACVEALALTTARGIAPAAVVVLCADAGDRITVAVDEGALRRGIDLVSGAVRERRAAQDRGYDELDARPGPHCAFCTVRDACPPHAAWAQGPGRRHAGLPRLDLDALS